MLRYLFEFFVKGNSGINICTTLYESFQGSDAAKGCDNVPRICDRNLAAIQNMYLKGVHLPVYRAFISLNRQARGEKCISH